MESPQITCPQETAITVLEIPVVEHKTICHLPLGTTHTNSHQRIVCGTIDNSEISTGCDFEFQITGS